MGPGSVLSGSDPCCKRVIVHPVEIVKRFLVRRPWQVTLSMRAAAHRASGRCRVVPKSPPAAPHRQQAEQAETGECQNRWLGDTGRRDRLNPRRGAHQGGVQRHRVELARSRIAGAISTECPAIPFDVIVKSVNPSLSPVKASVKSTKSSTGWAK